MKLEIKTKCSTCDEEMHHLVERGLEETILYMDPCPHCHPSKPEKVTPPRNVLIELRMKYFPIGCFIRTMSLGERCDSDNNVKGRNVSGSDIGFVSGDQWRYPGESDDEWKK